MCGLGRRGKEKLNKVAPWWERILSLIHGKLDCIVGFPEKITAMLSNIQ